MTKLLFNVYKRFSLFRKFLQGKVNTLFTELVSPGFEYMYPFFGPYCRPNAVFHITDLSAG